MRQNAAMAKISEEARRCDKCGFQWWAVKAAKPGKIRMRDERARYGDRAAGVAGAAFEKTVQLSDWERYAVCARCGSQTVISVKDKGFIPTALAEAASAQGTTAATLLGEFQPGDKVVLRVLGFRGKTGVIEKRGLLGWNVRLDHDGSVVKGIDGKKLDRS